MPPKKQWPTCAICCDPMKKSVTCNFCDFESCITCASRFLLEGAINPSCMSCKRPWGRKFLTDSFGKTFMNTKYKLKREKDLFETEKSLLPETQPYATAQKELNDVNREIRQLTIRLGELKYIQRRLVAGGDISTLKKAATTLTIKCPVGDCRGFVCSSSMTCGVCDSKICKQCREEVKGDEHTCNKETVETVKLLARDTKGCPRCMTQIHKINGCDQMYCTQCHTAFSWTTGEIAIGAIHNPHYYEYLRTRRGGGAPPREVGDIPCGGVPTVQDMYKHWSKKEAMGRLRLLVHIQRVEFPKYTNDQVANNRDLRAKYINNEITEDAFKKTIQKRDKNTEKCREILGIMNTMVVAGSDIIRTFLVDDDEDACIERFDAMCTIVQGYLNDVSKVYTCVVPVILDYKFIITRKI